MRPTKTDTALERCVQEFAAFIERDTPETRAALVEARLRFYAAVQAEFRERTMP